MIRFKLGEADRENLGAPEVLEYDEDRLLLSEARVLQRTTSMNPKEMAEGLKTFNPDAVAALVWLALRRAGVEVDFGELDFNLAEFMEVSDEDEGKDPASASTRT